MTPRTVPLAEICLINPAHPKRLASDTVVSFLGMADLDAETGTTSQGEDQPYTDVAKGYTSFRDGDILVAKITPCFQNGKIAQAKLKRAYGAGSTEFHVVRPMVESDSRYLLHFLRQEWIRREGELRMTGSGGQRRVPDAYLRSARVPLPSLAERMRIAALLDQIESLRAKRRRAIALLGELQQSIFLDMFGDPGVNSRDWPLLPLKDLATVFSDGPFGSNLKSAHYEQEGVRVVRLQNIGVGEFLDADAAYVSHEHFANLRKHACTPGDVLVATLGDPNIRACIQPQSLELALNKADCVQIRVDEERADRQYVCALLNQPGLERKASSMMQGQTRVRISMGRLRELEVPLPPLDRQVEFKRRKAAIDTLKESHRTQLATLDELFISLQHRAFNGRLGNTTPPTPCADARAGEPSPPSTTLHATAVAEQSRLF